MSVLIHKNRRCSHKGITAIRVRPKWALKLLPEEIILSFVAFSLRDEL
jgi:hypothetical protein